MADVLIHRCTLRVVRRNGWSWGPNPRSIAQEAVRVLPELLAQALAGMFVDEEADREISAPIRIRIPVRMTELAGGSHSPSPSRPGMTAMASLDQRVEFALRAALGLTREPATESRPVRASSPMPLRFTEERQSESSIEGEALPRLLLAWHEHGVLERRLAALALEQIETWHHRLSINLSTTVPQHSELASRIEEFLTARATAPVPAHRGHLLRRRILIATEAAAQFSLPAADHTLWWTLDRLLPLEPLSSTESITPIASRRLEPMPHSDSQSPSGPAPASPPSTFHLSPTTFAFKRDPADWSVKVDCALPFLILGPLARLGYFATLEAVLEAAGLTAGAPLFATALAYKVLDPPPRGWQRSPASTLAAAALAASSAPIPEDSLLSFARRIAPHTAALDLILTDALIAGHTRGAPVTLYPGFLALDTEGCFPIAWDADPVPVLTRLAPSIVLIPAEAADPSVLRDLAAAGITFLSEVPPTRSEHWQRVGDSWTNSLAPLTEPLRSAARAMPAALEDARAFAKELITARPAVIRASSPELDRSLTMAASVALGMISWKLWRSRGRTTPHQVLERYADLEGRIRFDPGAVNVRLPLGRRQQELQDNGLLATVAGVPWLGRRRVEFGGG